MAKVHGRALLPLPTQLTTALENLGYRRMEHAEGTHYYRHPKTPDLFFTATRTNLPGEEAVIANWKGQPTTRREVDYIIARLTTQINDLRRSTR